jgi:hypothetical protein
MGMSLRPDGTPFTKKELREIQAREEEQKKKVEYIAEETEPGGKLCDDARIGIPDDFYDVRYSDTGGRPRANK